MEHKDYTGNSVKVGDYVVYATQHCDSAVLRYAIVVGLGQSKPPTYSDRKPEPTLKVLAVERQWQEGWNILKDGMAITLGRLDVVLSISAAQLPNEVRSLLDAAFKKRTVK